MSRVVAFMRDLVAKGMSWEDAAEFGERMEENIADALAGYVKPRTAAAERQARFRERQKAENVTEGVTSNVTNLPLPPETEVSPTPPSRTQTPIPNQIPPIVPLSPSKRALLNGLKIDFDRWWDAYPRKVAKGSAEKAFPKAMKLTDVETLIRASRAMATTATEQKFIPHPATWLNDKRWLDTPEHPPDEPGRTSFDLDKFERERAERRRKLEAELDLEEPI